MKMKRFFTITLIFLLVASLFYGCGAKSENGMAASGELKGEIKDESVTSDMVTGATGNSTPIPASGQKLVRRVWLTAETEEMDTLLGGVAAKIEELGGYVESRNIQNGSQYSGRRYRSGELTIRIPAERLDAFVSHVSDSANITNNREITENITLSYVATQSRITALETEEKRLLELLAGAKDMGDLLEIEKRLTEVRSELETVTSQLKIYDNQVSYGTIFLTVQEVKEYTVTEEPTTVWGRIGAGFMESLKDLGAFFTELFVFLIAGLPYIVLIGVVGFGIILLIKRGRKRKNGVKPEEKKE